MADVYIIDAGLGKQAGSGDELSKTAREMVTILLVGAVFDASAGVLSVQQLKRMAGEQNIDEALARRLGEAFQKEHGLEGVRSRYFRGKKSPGPHFNPFVNRPHGRIGGSSAKDARTAAKKKEVSGRMLTIDSPEVRLHELGHALSKKKGNWSSKLYGVGPLLGFLGGSIAGGAGKPGIAAVISTIGQSPRLLEEHRASAYAMEFLKRNLPKDQAEKAHRVLKRAFSTYLFSAGASVMSQAAYGYLKKKRYV